MAITSAATAADSGRYLHPTRSAIAAISGQLLMRAPPRWEVENRKVFVCENSRRRWRGTAAHWTRKLSRRRF
jgi:hypothetical protein